jgi:phosphoribosylformylglycinamidine synthase
MFGEDQGRFLVTLSDTNGVILLERAIEEGIPCAEFGLTGGDAIGVLDVNDKVTFGTHYIPLADLRRAHEGFFPNLMGSDAALA